MQAIIETVFDTVYLISVILIGITMIVKCNGNKQYRLFGIMAVFWLLSLELGILSFLCRGNSRYAQGGWKTTRLH